MIKTKQFRSILLLMLKLGVLCAVAFVLFQKINAFPSGFKLPGKMDPSLAALFLGIMPLNWFVEWLKWKAIVAQKKIHSSIRWHSFLSGIISSVITPAYAGNFIGRMFYFDKKPLIFLDLIKNDNFMDFSKWNEHFSELSFDQD